MSWDRRGRRWEVRFLGDPDYGRDSWDVARQERHYDCSTIEAPDASTAARRALVEWRRLDAAEVKEEGWYGEGTVIGVREVVEPPPVKTFVVSDGRPKYERQVAA